MKILSISTVVVRVNHLGDWLHVVVETDAGITGVGEASHSANDALCVAAVEQFAQALAGQEPRQISRIRQELARNQGGLFYNTALSGLEQALWDVLAQSLGVPLHHLFGGALGGEAAAVRQYQPPCPGSLSTGVRARGAPGRRRGLYCHQNGPFRRTAPPLPLPHRDPAPIGVPGVRARAGRAQGNW